MIIKKHIANNTKEGISYISKNFQDEGLIISNSRVDGKNVIYFAVNEKQEISVSKTTFSDNKNDKYSDHNSDSNFTSPKANNVFNQSLAANDLDTIDLIRSTAKKIVEDKTPFEPTKSNKLGAPKNQVPHDNEINIGPESLRILEEIKSIVHQQSHTYLEYRKQESNRLNNLLGLMADQFSLIQQSHESILAVQVASQESIKHLADAIIELKTQGISSNENIDISENMSKEIMFSYKNQRPGKSIFAGLVFISMLFLTPSLGKSGFDYTLDAVESIDKIGNKTIYDLTNKQSSESYRTLILSNPSIENINTTTNSFTSNETTSEKYVDSFEENLIQPPIESNATIITKNDGAMVDIPEGQWSIRMGLFSIKENSDRLVNRLKELDFKTYTKAMALNSNMVTAVYVGPMYESEVTDLQLHLSELFDLKPVIESFKE